MLSSEFISGRVSSSGVGGRVISSAKAREGIIVGDYAVGVAVSAVGMAAE